jgi:hypothetical protein
MIIDESKLATRARRDKSDSTLWSAVAWHRFGIADGTLCDLCVSTASAFFHELSLYARDRVKDKSTHCFLSVMVDHRRTQRTQRTQRRRGRRAFLTKAVPGHRTPKRVESDYRLPPFPTAKLRDLLLVIHTRVACGSSPEHSYVKCFCFQVQRKLNLTLDAQT